MATIEPYTLKSGATRYRVRYRTPDRRQTDKRGFTTKREAKAFAATVEVDKMTGSYVSPAAGRATINDIAKDWLALKKTATRPSHYRTLESAWRNHVKPKWGTVPVKQISTGGVEAWITALRTDDKNYSPTTVHRVVGVLQGLLDEAVKHGRLARNPARGVENLPARRNRRHVYLTPGDVAAVVAATDDDTVHGLIVETLAYTGLRWSELVALQVQDYNPERRRLNIHQAAPEVGARPVLGPTKSGKARTVPVPGFLVERLTEHVQGQSTTALLFPGDKGGYRSRPDSRNGWFRKAVDAAGVEHVTPHGLRHTAASLAVSAGANVLALQRMLGHESAALTLDRYSDLFDSDLDAVAEVLDSVRVKPNVGT